MLMTVGQLIEKLDAIITENGGMRNVILHRPAGYEAIPAAEGFFRALWKHEDNVKGSEAERAIVRYILGISVDSSRSRSRKLEHRDFQALAFFCVVCPDNKVLVQAFNKLAQQTEQFGHRCNRVLALRHFDTHGKEMCTYQLSGQKRVHANHTPEEIHQILSNNSQAAASRIFGVAKKVVASLQGRYGITSPDGALNPLQDYNHVHETYTPLEIRTILANNSEAQIGRIFGVSTTAVPHLRRHYEIASPGRAIQTPLDAILRGEHNAYDKSSLSGRLVKGDEPSMWDKPYCCSNEKCELYGKENPTWLGKPLRLQLHHHEPHLGHLMSNMDWLCPNCHGQEHMRDPDKD